MGIPGFSSWLTRTYPEIQKECIEDKPYTDNDGVYHPVDETRLNSNGMEANRNLQYTNDIIHKCAELFPDEDSIIQLVVNYMNRIFSIVRPCRLIYMALDGITARAKMNDQRSARFLKSKNISDGMKDKFLTTDQTQTEAWRLLKVILSDANVPGEGEHKIIDFIRRQHAQQSHDANTRHVVYDSDSDLILLGLVLHEPHFTIIREDSQDNISLATASNNIESKYIFIHLSTLRKYLEYELKIRNLSSFRWNLDHAIDDWVFICLLLGKDFLPKSP